MRYKKSRRSSVAEHVLGKDGASGSIPLGGTIPERFWSKVKLKERAEAPKWFVGTVLANFDGRILESDFRGTIPTLHLLLTANEKVDIRCTAPGFTIDELRPLIGHRARATGKATYDGTSGIPVRLELTELPQLIKGDADFLRWSGAFEPFHSDEWEEQ